MRVKGVASATKRLASGETRTYWYAWRGGPKLDGRPGTPEFLASLKRALDTRPLASGDTLSSIILAWNRSAERGKLSAPTIRAYRAYETLIEAQFGTMPLDALADPRVRGLFKEWRDGMAATPRKADYAWSVLTRLLSFAKDRGMIAVNHCERGGRLSKPDRRDNIWTDADIAALAAVSSPEVFRVFCAALWTGQREGDLLAMPWSAWRDGALHLKQSKGGRRVVVPVAGPLAAMLAGMKKHGPLMFTASHHRPWTGDGFRSSFGKACDRAGIGGLTFHDTRGTFDTRASLAGANEIEKACVMGHAVDGARTSDRSYLSRSRELAQACISLLEQNESGTVYSTALQTVCKPARAGLPDHRSQKGKRL